jgi:putative ABC transport system permease protein
LAVYVLVGFVSGWYPSIVLSRFRPLKVLKSNTLNDSSNKTALYLRRGLVILQFAISVILIIGAVTVYRQLVFIQNKKPGFDKEQVVLLKTSGIQNREKLVMFKNQIKQLASVESAAGTSIIPGERAPFLTVRIPGLEQEQGNEGDDAMNMRVMSADVDMLETFGFKIADGRTFSEKFGTDSEQAFIVNQAAVEAYELENPVGSRFEYLYGLEEPKAGKIIGVVEDFHYASLHAEVEPLMIHIMSPFYRYLAVRLSGENQLKIISDIEEMWHADFSSQPFDYFFLDSFYDNLYKSEMNLKTVITYFTFLAIFIAFLGLFGLAAYITELRTKEIGIRKVLGASIGAIVYSLSKEFIILVVIANVMAWLPAWYFLDNWLSTFAFRVSMGVGVFVVTTLLSLIIAFLTVGAQSTRAAVINPSQALKYE